MPKRSQVAGGARPGDTGKARSRSADGTTATPEQAEVIELQRKTGNHNVNRILSRQAVEAVEAPATTPATPTDPVRTPGSNAAAQSMFRTAIRDQIEVARRAVDKPRPTRADFQTAKDAIDVALGSSRPLGQSYAGTNPGLYDQIGKLNNGLIVTRTALRARLGEHIDSTEMVRNLSTSILTAESIGSQL